MEHHDDVCLGNFMEEVLDHCPWDWTTAALATFQDAREHSMVVVIAESHY